MPAAMPGFDVDTGKLDSVLHGFTHAVITSDPFQLLIAFLLSHRTKLYFQILVWRLRYFISSHSFSSVAVRGVLCYFNTLKAYLRYFTVAHYSFHPYVLSLLPPFVPPSFLPSLSFTGTLLYNIFQQGVLPPRYAAMGPDTRDGEIDLQNNQGWREMQRSQGRRDESVDVRPNQSFLLYSSRMSCHSDEALTNLTPVWR